VIKAKVFKQDTQLATTKFKELAKLALVVFAFIVYLRVTTLTLVTLDCVAIDGFQGTRLRTETSVVCYQGRHLLAGILGWFILCVMLIGGPIMLYLQTKTGLQHISMSVLASTSQVVPMTEETDTVQGSFSSGNSEHQLDSPNLSPIGTVSVKLQIQRLNSIQLKPLLDTRPYLSFLSRQFWRDRIYFVFAPFLVNFGIACSTVITTETSIRIFFNGFIILTEFLLMLTLLPFRKTRKYYTRIFVVLGMLIVQLVFLGVLSTANTSVNSGPEYVIVFGIVLLGVLVVSIITRKKVLEKHRHAQDKNAEYLAQKNLVHMAA
jgi:hypothetical protein